MLRNKDVISSATLLQTLFPILTTTHSKALRTQLYNTIITDLRNANAKTKNHRLNRTIQTVLFGLVDSGKADANSVVGLWAVKIVRELWRRNVWDDARSVEIMKEAALSANPKVIAGGVRFFLGVDQEREEKEDSDEDEAPDVKKLKFAAQINKSAKSKRKVEKALHTMKRKEKQKNKPHPLNFSALHLLHDPQGFAESLFSKHLSKTNAKISMELKLAVLQLTSRLIGLHKLELLAFYSYILKYLTPRQRDVTHFLVCAAQAAHDLVPPDALEPIVRKIADEFVSEGVASEVAAAGLNGIREICARAPLAINPTLLQDLTEYKGSKDKGVMMAARSLIGLYREVAPEMLKRKDRGKVASMEMKDRESLRFGEEKAGGIEGIELLEAWKEEQRKLKRGDVPEGEEGEDAEEEDEDEEGEGWEGWELEEDSDEEESGWINVGSDDEIEVSDSEDETPAKKKAKKAEEDKKKADAAEADSSKPDASTEDSKPDEATQALKAEEARISTLATTRILTPADLAKLAELRLSAGLDKLTGKKPVLTDLHETALTTSAIEGYRHEKADKEARLAKIHEGREGREKFGSKRGKRDGAHSTTNREKARKKNAIMMVRKTKAKQKMKLTDVQKLTKEHHRRGKRGGKRGNAGN